MATAKLGTLLIRTLAKPISNQIKVQAKQHETFRGFCVSLAQRMYRGEVKLRTNLLGEPAKQIRPLSETKAIENGANALAEGFLFAVAAALILTETWRSSRSQTKRRDAVDDQLDDLKERLLSVEERVKEVGDGLEGLVARNEELTHVLERIVAIGMKGGWVEVKDVPKIRLFERGAVSQTPNRAREDGERQS
ncbi:OPA3-domain-containing protein [Neolentinus lepideus HHB14362 ss-1]|uniref:OPA3-domain-containing protein n=1 Tax=Neolentinus lepideus HHB14362 ss-1 TaxID=1314782 RepID=A0A165MXA6_9AGAM|nr:OPA3-domain-containing protein [Neolentinus lepideus HHB14362 ss-1]